ncbi:uncharacterized protein BT62DRAFT_931562 [Guyanagaster necrorhizus]|uniref:Uncharacterized protein n=1 Tax=Guyanagaster necrorhizus TaxID=856835 RepID=A0A9P7VT78_9AGAR|nr:uncharacterized protein BT62DRAFT_931562 [Guyanagaster necrorhizus MCA 3950]KAG7446983.1 hypothetical protein BT62DRAFT_931562 [Guyanagaster necrorhizus MCA 3950]
MSETRRLLEAANALSTLLRASGVPHAFHGSVLTACLANQPHSDEIFCIVEGGQTQAHPFRRVRDAVVTSEHFTLVQSPWTNRLHVTYRRLIPAIEIEILPAGETGPRRLDGSTVMKIHGVPFLTISEFVRAKLKSWMISRQDRDARDITFVMPRYWNRVDVNRIPETDMDQFVQRNADAKPAWTAIKKKYRM